MSQTAPRKPSKLSRLLLHVPVPWVFVLGYLLGVGLQFAIPRAHHSAAVSSFIVTCGAIMFAAGAVIAGWGLVLFYKARTTTTPGKAAKLLVLRGPYRFTRNPMYVGLTLAYLGEMGLQLQIAPIIPLVLVIAYVHCTVIPLEENQLGALFGEEYAKYCGSVPRWL